MTDYKYTQYAKINITGKVLFKTVEINIICKRYQYNMPFNECKFQIQQIYILSLNFPDYFLAIMN